MSLSFGPRRFLIRSFKYSSHIDGAPVVSARQYSLTDRDMSPTQSSRSDHFVIYHDVSVKFEHLCALLSCSVVI